MPFDRRCEKRANVYNLLEQRQVSPWNWSINFLLARTVRKRQVRLASILDQRLYDGHVVLGFNFEGDCLISYCCQISYPEHKYWLYWWHFDLNNLLTLVSKVELFRDEVIEDDLYIAAIDDGNSTFILGCRVGKELESKPCYVTILPTSKSRRGSKYSVHFKFELFLSIPRVFFALNHYVPGCLILNTGVSLVCVKCDVLLKGELLDLVDDCPSHKQYTDVDMVHFSMPASFTATSVTGPSTVFKAYNGNTQMQAAYTHKALSDGFAVKQTVMDIDSWLSRNLPLLLSDEDYEYHCLSDYNLKVTEIDLQSNITFILIAVIQVTSTATLRCVKHMIITLIGKWEMNSGCCKLLYLSQKEKKESNFTSTSNQWSQEWFNVWQEYVKTILPSAIIRGLGNEGIFTGKSLQAIPHPYFPVTLVL